MSEENCLDDFFANKDKAKKKSTKSKITAVDIEQMLEKKLNKGSKKIMKNKQKEDTEQDPHVLDVKMGEDDSEWKEVEEEVVKDYSGLKIQSLNISSKNGLDQESNGNNLLGEDETGEKKDAIPGPWKPLANLPEPEPAPAPEPEPEPVPVVVETKPGKYVPPGARQQSNVQNTIKIAPAEKPSGKYVPPALRQKQAAQSNTSALEPTKMGWGSKPKTATLNVSSVEDFPSLKAASSLEQGAPVQDLDRVKAKTKPTASPLTSSERIPLNNKFGALEEGGS